jgi:hypothetical protein
VFRVYGSAVDGEVTMVQVQLHLDPQPDAVAAVGHSARVTAPDQVSYVVQRTSQNLTLMAFTPRSKRQCIVPMYARLGASVSTPMTINTTDESGTFGRIGIYLKAVAAEEMNTLVSDLCDEFF